LIRIATDADLSAALRDDKKRMAAKKRDGSAKQDGVTRDGVAIARRMAARVWETGKADGSNPA
jgi:hypothetical protein